MTIEAERLNETCFTRTHVQLFEKRIDKPNLVCVLAATFPNLCKIVLRRPHPLFLASL